MSSPPVPTVSKSLFSSTETTRKFQKHGPSVLFFFAFGADLPTLMVVESVPSFYRGAVSTLSLGTGLVLVAFNFLLSFWLQSMAFFFWSQSHLPLADRLKVIDPPYADNRPSFQPPRNAEFQFLNLPSLRDRIPLLATQSSSDYGHTSLKGVPPMESNW